MGKWGSRWNDRGFSVSSLASVQEEDRCRAKEKSHFIFGLSHRSSGSKATGVPRAYPSRYLCGLLFRYDESRRQTGDQDQETSSTDIDVEFAHSRPFIRDFRHPAVRQWRTGAPRNTAALRKTESSPVADLLGLKNLLGSSRDARLLSRVVLTRIRSLSARDDFCFC